MEGRPTRNATVLAAVWQRLLRLVDATSWGHAYPFRCPLIKNLLPLRSTVMMVPLGPESENCCLPLIGMCIVHVDERNGILCYIYNGMSNRTFQTCS